MLQIDVSNSTPPAIQYQPRIYYMAPMYVLCLVKPLPVYIYI